MPTYLIVNDMDGTFRVHRKDCGDLYRRMTNGAWAREAESAKEAVRLERESLREEFGDDADDFTFVILPCTREASQ